MEDKKLEGENSPETQPSMHVNEYGETKDSAVVIEEETRTVLLTENETIVIEKEKTFDVPPKNRERKVYAGMWGNPELGVVGAALLAVLATILMFVFVVLPAQKELDDNRTKLEELDKKLTEAKSRYGTITTTQGRVTELSKSVNDFEANYLSTETNGKTAFYQQINGLIAAYNLTNTSGPDYAPLEIVDPSRTNRQQSEEDKGRSKFVSIFPGQYITMTLDGSYQNLRRFISEIETNRNQFVIISAIELEPSENKEKEKIDQSVPVQASINNQPDGQVFNPTVANPTGAVNPAMRQPQPQKINDTKIDRGKTRGETVTLRLEMATYFRRPNFQPLPVITEP